MHYVFLTKLKQKNDNEIYRAKKKLLPYRHHHYIFLSIIYDKKIKGHRVESCVIDNISSKFVIITILCL